MSPRSRMFLDGFLAGAPFVIVIAPFALIFGAVATEAGFDVRQTLAMSFVVIAGASQFAAVQLIEEQAPLLVILAASLAVNLRMAMYSAAMVPHIGAVPLWQRAVAAYFLVDQTYGVSIRRYDAEPWRTPGEKILYFFGAVLPVGPFWYGFTYAGAVAGAAIPADYALDFAVPITFLALVAPYLGSLPHLAAALVSVSAALLLAGLPPGTGLLLAAAAGMGAGAGVELWLERRR